MFRSKFKKSSLMPSIHLGMQTYKYNLTVYRPLPIFTANVFRNFTYRRFKKWLQCQPNTERHLQFQDLHKPVHKRMCADAFTFQPFFRTNQYIHERLTPSTSKKLFHLCMHSNLNQDGTHFEIVHGFKLCTTPFRVAVYNDAGTYLGQVYVKINTRKQSVLYYLDSQNIETLSLFIFNSLVDEGFESYGAVHNA